GAAAATGRWTMGGRVGRRRRGVRGGCAVAAGAGGRQCGAAVDRNRACGAGVVPAPLLRAAPGERPRRHVGGRRRRGNAPAWLLAAVFVVAARAVRRRFVARRDLRGGAERRDGSLVARTSGRLASELGRVADGYTHRVSQRRDATRRRRRRDRRPVACAPRVA